MHMTLRYRFYKIFFRWPAEDRRTWASSWVFIRTSSSSFFFACNEHFSHDAFSIDKHLVRSVLCQDITDAVKCSNNTSSPSLRFVFVFKVLTHLNLFESYMKISCVVEQEELNNDFDGYFKHLTHYNLLCDVLFLWKGFIPWLFYEICVSYSIICWEPVEIYKIYVLL